MSFLSQMMTLLTEPPGNLVYHLVTLFALQAVFAISLSQWLRERDNREAWRGWVASGLLVAGRLLLLFVGLILANDPLRALAYLPPLEQALNGMTAVLITWALTRPSPTQPRLNDLLLLLSLLVITLMTISFTIAWQPMAAAGVLYTQTTQAVIWLGVQTGIYACGLVLALLNKTTRSGLRPWLMAVLLGTAVIALISLLGRTAVNSHMLFWTRLGYLVAFPMWAALVYRQSVAPLMRAQQANRPAVQQLIQSLTLATQTLQTFEPENRAFQSVTMIEQMVEASFVGVGIFPPTNKEIIHLTSNLPQVGADAPRSWQLDLVEWPPFRAAIRKRGGVELLPDGQGGRHLRVLYEAMEVGPFGSMLVEPMFVADEPVGMLLLAKGAPRQADDQTAVPARWSAREKAIAPALAAFVGQAITNSFRATSQERMTAVPAPIMPGNEIPTGSGYLIALEAERNKLAAELDTTTNRAAQAETRAIVAMKRAHDLAQTLEEMERIQRDERIEMMEREIDTLRESLAEAEDAMAMAAAGESGLSTEWVMLTITRYSGQLEEAQARIELLENELSRQESGMANELLVALIQELRTPMTSISGFTDLLLGETMGILGTRQRDLVQRVQANSRRMGSLLDQVLQLVANREQATPVYEETVDVQAVIETAVTSMMPQIREKNCRLDMEIAPDLPALTMKQNDLQQIVTHLLGNACQAAGNNGRVTITAQANTVQSPTHADGPLPFLQITISDSGSGIQPADLPRVFDPRLRADAPLIKGLGDTSTGLSVAHDLAQVNGGRIWVNSQIGAGSTFSLLFPLVGEDGSGTAVPPANGAVN